MQQIKISAHHLKLLIWCSIRYTIPRSSGMTYDLLEIIQKHIDILEEWERNKLALEIETFVVSNSLSSYDKPIWAEIILLLKGDSSENGNGAKDSSSG